MLPHSSGHQEQIRREGPALHDVVPCDKHGNSVGGEEADRGETQNARETSAKYLHFILFSN